MEDGRRRQTEDGKRVAAGEPPAPCRVDEVTRPLTRRRVLCSRTGKCSSENVRYCSFARRMLYNIVPRFTNALSQR